MQSRFNLLILSAALLSGLVFYMSRDTAPTASTSLDIEAATTGIDGTANPDPAASRLAKPDVGDTSGAREVVPEETEATAIEDRQPRTNSVFEYHGRVVNSAGRPIEGARVLLREPLGTFEERFLSTDKLLGEAVFTDAGGVFRVQSAKLDSLQLLARAPGHVTLSVHVSSSAEADRGDLGQFTLQPAAILIGRVTDELGNSVEGASVRLHPPKEGGLLVIVTDNPDRVDAKTDTSGRFELDHLPVGPWTLTVFHERHPETTANGSCEHTGRQADEVQIALEPGGSISGNVLRIEAGSEVDYNVVARRKEFELFGTRMVRRCEISTGGAFAVHGLVLGEEYLVSVQEASSSGWGEVAHSQVIPCEPGETGVTLTLSPPAGLSLRAIDAKSGQPVEEFEVSLGTWMLESLKGDDGSPIMQHPDGRATFADVTADEDSGAMTLSLKIEAEGYAVSLTSDVKVTAGMLTNLGDILLQPVPRLQVLVVSNADGEPVEGASVRLTAVEDPTPAGTFTMTRSASVSSGELPREFSGRNMRGATTGKDGIAHLTTLPDTRSILSVAHIKFAVNSLEERAYTTDGERIEVRLLEGGSVRVMTFTTSGEPLEKVSVFHRGTDGKRAKSERSDSDGVAVFDHLQPGTHAFKLGVGNQAAGSFFRVMTTDGPQAPEPGWFEVEVVDSGEDELILTARPQGNLTGRVTVRGVPLPGASLNLHAREQDSDSTSDVMRSVAMMNEGAQARSDGDGDYRIEGKAVGEYDLVIDHTSRWMDASFRVSVEEGDNQFNVDMSDSTIEGRVLDTAGEGIPDAELSIGRPQGEGPRRERMVMRMVVSGPSGGAISIGGSSPKATTRADGSFRMGGLEPEADLVLTVRAKGYQPGELSIEPLNFDELRDDLDVVLRVGSDLKVSVLDAAGNPGAFGSLALDPLEIEGDPESRRESFQEGSALVSGLAPGLWKVTATLFAMPRPGDSGPPKREEQTQEVLVLEGQPAQLEFQF